MQTSKQQMTVPLFSRADECSGSDYTCNGCGSNLGDHIAPKGHPQCPRSAQQPETRERNIEKFALDAWSDHVSGTMRIKPIPKVIIGATEDCFPLHASAVRIEGYGIATYRLCMTDEGRHVCTVLSAIDEAGDEISPPVAVAYNRVDALLPAVRLYLYAISQAHRVGEESSFEYRSSQQTQRG